MDSLRLWALVSLLTAAAACSAPRSAPRATAPGGEYDLEALQALVLQGARSEYPSPCTAGAILAVVDAEEAGARIDALLETATRPQTSTSSPAGRCLESLTVARIVRLARLRRVDLAQEMASVSPIARAVALRYVALMGADEQRPYVLQGFADSDLQVRIVAYLAAARLQMTDAVPALQARMDKAGPSERPWLCRALTSLGAPGGCETRAQMYVMEAGEAGDCEARIGALQSPEPKTRIEAMSGLLVDQFGRFARPLDRIGSDHERSESCDVPERIEDAILDDSTQPIRLRAMTAARILWQRHPPIGEGATRPAPVRPDGLVTCSSNIDCRAPNLCVRRGDDERGVCAVLVDRLGRSVSRVQMRGTAGCWSFADCPPLYSCHRWSPYPQGICVRR